MVKKLKTTSKKSSDISALLTSKKALSIRHAKEFMKNLSKAEAASIGVIMVKTKEPYRCKATIHEWAIKNDKDFRFWTLLTGWQVYDKPVAMLDDTGEEHIIDSRAPASDKDPSTFKLMSALDTIHSGDDQRSPDDAVYVCMSVHPFLEHPDVQQFIKAHVQYCFDNSKTLILFVPEYYTIPQDIQDDVYVIDFKTPSHAEFLEHSWNSIIDDLDENLRPAFSSNSINLILQNATGMTSHELDTAISLTLVEHGKDLVSEDENVAVQYFIDMIRKTKVDIIKKTDILELMPTAKMDDVGGLELLKEWLSLRTKSFSEEARKYGVDQPRGILVAGPPGCGKSLISKAVSATLQVPCIKLDIGRVFQKFVGESEERIRKALSDIEAMSPCVLFLDEIDKGLGGIGNDNNGGTTSRVFGSLLTWMQERDTEHSPIFVIMTANNVEQLPPELIRKGRLDEIFSVTFPNAEERKTILKIHLEKRGHSIEEKDYEVIIKCTEFFVGAEIEAIVKEAIIRSFNDGLPKVSVEYLVEEARRIVPISKAFKEQIKRMHLWAKNNARPASRTADDDTALDKSDKKPKLNTTPKRTIKLSGFKN